MAIPHKKHPQRIRRNLRRPPPPPINPHPRQLIRSPDPSAALSDEQKATNAAMGIDDETFLKHNPDYKGEE